MIITGQIRRIERLKFSTEDDLLQLYFSIKSNIAANF